MKIRLAILVCVLAVAASAQLPRPSLEQFPTWPPPPMPVEPSAAEIAAAQSNAAAVADEDAKRVAMLIVLARAAGMDTNTILEDSTEQALNRATLFDVAREQAVSFDGLELTGAAAVAFAAGVAAALAARRKQ